MYNGTNSAFCTQSRMIKNHPKVPKFFFVGLVSTASHYVVLYILFMWFKVELVLATSFGALVGAAVNYLLNYFYTFDSQRKHFRAARVFILVVGIGMSINALIVWLVFHQLSQTALLSQISATLITFIWNYLAHKRWTF
ncbi:hypothetical protein MNBD_GAMMA08-2380 [hydrothermal vent metagenome]|uniref:GtrA/DPMS transmembrane domain-containing protein n=1 Tax=hydrothermal vent metagenome TaxID=652676 RepID=A0A3B0XCT9_9ZZZZ